MSTEQRNRFAVATAAHIELPHVTSRAVLLAIAVPLIGSFFLVRPPFVLPLVSVIALASTAIIAFAAWCMSTDRNDAGISLWDVAGAYAFIGFAAGMLSEPQQVSEFWSVPTEPTQ
ncbi:MAG TPA: hypothetical protein VFS68_06860 [Candidatus Udaeobacter sp.]|jgi:hypothetical protein|nr:hypothetical protein [Candidatus Udaeobacter sp.]